jgi:hypothetical protein
MFAGNKLSKPFVKIQLDLAVLEAALAVNGLMPGVFPEHRR